MRNILLTTVFVAFFASCSSFQKVYKSDDVALKNKTAEALYKEEKYTKALKLYEQVVPQYRGKPQAERVMFYYADSYYQLRDHYLAGYQFDRFVKSYPKSQKLEEASFKAAKSYYYLSPRYSLDQSDSDKAVDKLQNFINTYPESSYIEEANKIVQELRVKSERKYYEVAKQYHHMERYKAAIAAFDNFVIDYPGSSFRERAIYYKFDAAYRLASNSLPELVQQRMLEAKDHYRTFNKYYGSSGEFVEQAANSNSKIDEKLREFDDNK